MLLLSGILLTEVSTETSLDPELSNLMALVLFAELTP
jgi:hypothetical protein